ncbi:50S ribosomal protein L13 [Membranicola marinus]|uniref:Large ribosomal subunit protein uL13 n=1 Tax=Membranihabitans marinus TaxID=1227546 RepID=A0A953HQ39_9BACT|nr:50S ribosomal protein L13 [Membranihabitans marinus]MBY5959707.1 50S ribosomal protein L13 [Membranihabitans marinus]
MSKISYKTQYPTNETVEREWFVVDADGEKVGRIASKIASVLRGKHKPTYSPHVDAGDHVIVINADKVRFTGHKMEQKTYLTFSGYTGGQKSRNAAELMAKFPDRVLENAVRGMLPKTKLGRQMFKKLFIYTGSTHPHQAQQPKEFKF